MHQGSHVRTSNVDTYAMRYRLRIHHLLLEARHDMRIGQENIRERSSASSKQRKFSIDASPKLAKIGANRIRSRVARALTRKIFTEVMRFGSREWGLLEV